MHKFLVPTLVVSSVFISTLSTSLNQAVSANKKSTPQSFSWANISQILNSNKPPVKPRKGGSRYPQGICMVSPDAPQKPRIVWSQRPLFLWKGKVEKITVIPQESNQEWSQPVTQTQKITYTGEPLQPGKTYEWRVFVDNNLFRTVPFQIMEAKNRDRITVELNNLEQRLKLKGANKEAIALAKANYFADYNLWSDVLQQAYSVEKPSVELQKMIKNLDNLCQEPASPVNHSTNF